MDDRTTVALAEAARAAMENAYAPYSRFSVGAAVLAESGKIYSGCNIENASYGLSICAERSAIGKMICAGERSIEAIAISASTGEAAFPCGACRQVIAEFAAANKPVPVCLTSREGTKVFLLSDLLPHAFKL